MTESAHKLRIWGARGTVPTPNAKKMRFGGHTCCLAAELAEDEVVVLDAGSGIRPLGQRLASTRDGKPTRYHLFFSHYHLDHVEGFPYFQPLYDPNSTITIYGADSEGLGVDRILKTLMAPPYFPVPLSDVPATVDYVSLVDQSFRIQNVDVDILPLTHPGGSLCYRLSHGDNRVIFATDHEHGDPATDEALVRFADGARYVIYDTTYVEHEYESLRKGWGHSTWYAAVQLALRARVENLILFHHHPDYTDDELAAVCRVAQVEFENTSIAAQGMELDF